MHPLSGALPLPYLLVRVTRGIRLAIGTCLVLLTVEILGSAGLLRPSQYLDGTIVMTLCLMVPKSRANSFLLA